MTLERRWKQCDPCTQWIRKKKKKWEKSINLIHSPSFAERGPFCFEFSRCEARESSLPLTRLPRDPRAAATDIYQWARSWKVDDVGNAGVFDSAELGAEADVFLRAPLILLPPPNHPRAPFWRPVRVSEQLRRPPPPPPHPPPSQLLTPPSCLPPSNPPAIPPPRLTTPAPRA